MRIFLITIFVAFFHAHSLGATVEDFIAQASLRDMSLSPNGQYLAIVWNVDKTRIVTVQDISKDGNPIIMRFGDLVTRPHEVNWANDDRLLVRVQVPYRLRFVKYKAEKDPDEFNFYDFAYLYKTVVVSPNGGNSQILEKSSVQHLLPDDPVHVLTFSSKGGRTYLHKVDVYTGEESLITHGGRRTYAFLISKKGDVKYRLDYLERAKSIQIYTYTEDKKWEISERIDFKEEAEREEDIGNFAGLLGEDQLVFIKKNEETGYDELVAYHIDKDEVETIVSLGGQDVYDVILESSSSEVLGYRSEEDDVIRSFYFNEDTQAQYEKIITKITEIGASSFSIHSIATYSDEAVIRTNGPNDPGAFHLYNYKNDSLDFLSYAYDNLTPEILATPAHTTYVTRDGANIKSYLLFPPGFKDGSPMPLVILPHGGPQARDYAYYNNFAQFIATRGYIVMQPNFRGSTGYGKEFEEAGYKQWGGVMQDDLEDGVNFMINKGYADANKVCIVGGSYGGYAALMGTIKTPDLYQCAVSINGVTDLIDIVKYDEKRLEEYPDLLEKIHLSIGDIEEDEDALEANSPILNVNKIEAPILLIAGKDDEVVPFKQSKRMARALKGADKEFTFIEIKDAGHNVMYYLDDIELVYKELETFLAEHLGVTENTL